MVGQIHYNIERFQTGFGDLLLSLKCVFLITGQFVLPFEGSGY